MLFPAVIRSLVKSFGAGAQTAPIKRLSGREREVLRLMARGMSNAEIAGELSIAAETVKTHVGSVLDKLGARDRTQAVIHAYESGFVSSAPE